MRDAIFKTRGQLAFQQILILPLPSLLTHYAKA